MIKNLVHFVEDVADVGLLGVTWRAERVGFGWDVRAPRLRRAPLGDSYTLPWNFALGRRCQGIHHGERWGRWHWMALVCWVSGR